MGHQYLLVLERERKEERALMLLASYQPVNFLFINFSLRFLVVPIMKCRLRLLKTERIKDFLLMEEEFLRNQERLKPQEERQEVR